MSNRTRSLFIAAACCVAVTPSQARCQAPGTAGSLLPARWVAPLHPGAGSAEVWAAGPHYKASFHDGFTFHPVLGAAYPRGLPWRFRTAAVAVGETVVAAPSAAPDGRPLEPRRFVYDLGAGVTERYDVSAEGVEQSFLLEQRPPASGDLVIQGRVESELACGDREPLHAPLVFTDAAGRAVVEYGQAIAIDAGGRTFPVDTGYREGILTLRLDAVHLDAAEFPLLVDPLVSRSLLSAHKGTFGAAESVRVATQADSIGLSYLVTFARQVAADDWDAFGFLVRSDLTAPTMVMSMTGLGITRHVRPAYVSGADRWIVVAERTTGSPRSRRTDLLVYLHDRTSTGLNSGTLQEILAPAGSTYRLPEVGGTAARDAGVHALIVYQADRTVIDNNTDNSEVEARFVNARNGNIAAPHAVGKGAGTSLDKEHPHVCRVGDGGSAPFMVVWQELDRTNAAGTWGIRGQLVHFTGNSQHTLLAPGTGALPHSIRPRVAGRGGHFLLAFARAAGVRDATGQEVLCQRFDWTGSQPTKRAAVLLAAAPAPRMRPLDIDFDVDTTSHWAVTYQGRSAPAGVAVARIGNGGGPTEHHVIGDADTARGGGVAYTPLGRRFLIVSNTAGDSSRVFGELLVHDAPGTSLYGTGCGGSIGVGTLPYAGQRGFSITLSGLAQRHAQARAFLGIGVVTQNIPLDAAGMPGCALNIQPAVTLLTSVDASLQAAFAVDLPDNPVFLGDVHCQWFVEDAAANAAGLVSTRGMTIRVRN